MKWIILIAMLVLFIGTLPVTVALEISYISVQDGDWNNTATWDLGTIPGTGDPAWGSQDIGAMDVESTNIFSCGTITISASYILNESLNSNDTCITIQADNVIIDGNGFIINYSQDGGNGEYGIFVSNYDNITIKNINFTEGLASGSSDYAIYFDDVESSLVKNNVIRTTGSSGIGIVLKDLSFNNVVLNNTIVTSGTSGIGIYLTNGADLNNLTNNTISANGASADAIFLGANADSNNIINNIVFGKRTGIYIFSGSGLNSIRNNTVTSEDHGIRIRTSDDNTLDGNNVVMNEAYDYGVFIEESEDSILINNNVNTSESLSYIIIGTTEAEYSQSIDNTNLAEGKPVNFTYNVDNLIFDGINFTIFGQIIFAYSENITITNSNISNDALSLLYTNDSTISNNTITSETGYGIFLYINSNNNFISNNFINTNSNQGQDIYVKESDLNTINGNNLETHGFYSFPIWLESSSGNSITYNNLTTNGTQSYGMLYSNADTQFNNFDYNNILTTGSLGRGIITTIMVNSNTFSYNNITTTTGSSSYGIFLEKGSDNNTFSNMIFNTQSPALYMNAFSNNFTLKDSTFDTHVAYDDFLALSGASGTWNFTNVTKTNGNPFNSTLTTSTGTMYYKWYYEAFANDTTNNVGLANVNILIYNNSGILQANLTTNLTGDTNRTEILEYIKTSSAISSYSNYTVNATYLTQTINYNHNLTSKQNIFDIFTFNLTPPTTTTVEGNPGSGPFPGTTTTINQTDNQTINGTTTTVPSEDPEDIWNDITEGVHVLASQVEINGHLITIPFINQPLLWWHVLILIITMIIIGLYYSGKLPRKINFHGG